MTKFFSGIGMGMIAGACVGLALSGMATEAEKQRLRRKATRAVHELGDMASDLGSLVSR